MRSVNFFATDWHRHAANYVEDFFLTFLFLRIFQDTYTNFMMCNEYSITLLTSLMLLLLDELHTKTLAMYVVCAEIGIQ